MGRYEGNNKAHLRQSDYDNNGDIVPMNNETIIDVLKDMLSNLCEGCGGCKNKCLDYQVLEYLIKEKGGKEQ